MGVRVDFCREFGFCVGRETGCEGGGWGRELGWGEGRGIVSVGWCFRLVGWEGRGEAVEGVGVL